MVDALLAVQGDVGKVRWAVVVLAGLTVGGVATVAALGAVYFLRRARAIRDADRRETSTTPDPWAESARRVAAEDLEDAL